MKQYIFTAVLASVLLTTSCSDDTVENGISDSQKEMISFSLSDGSIQTRAGFIGGDTKIVMRIQSNERGGAGVKYNRTCALAVKDEVNNSTSFSTVGFNTDDVRYWDDAHGRKSLLSVYAIAIPDKNDNNTLPTSTLKAGDNTDEKAWGSNADHTLTWLMDVDQTVENIANKDLVFSNNIKYGGQNGVYRWDFSTGNWKFSDNGGTNHDPGQMLFYQNGVDVTALPTEAAGHFDRGHMVFNHALSRMTIKLEEGTGFNTTSTSDFQFATNTNIKLLNMPISGTFNVESGQWAVSPTTGTINTIAPLQSYTTAQGEYRAQMLPGYKFNKTGTDNVMEFTIDDNTYYITQQMLFEALTKDANHNGVKDEGDGDGDLIDQASSDGIVMEMGKNYTFAIKVNKKGIESITATLVPWSDVKAADFPIKNGHINITTASATGTSCSDLYLYRYGQDMGSIITDDNYTAEEYSANYLTTGNMGVRPTETSTGSGIWTTSWFFEDNKTAYHIRSINSTSYGTDGNNVVNTDAGKTYFNMSNGTQADKDYHWGAPMKDVAFKYDVEKGYTDHLYNGIMAINDDQAINITELHMMSNINVILTTSTGSDAVQLRTGNGTTTSYQYASVQLTRLYSNARVDMGVGLVTPSGTLEDSQTMTVPTDYYKTNGTETNPFTWAVVPQPLYRGDQQTDYVGITITTPDNNQYYVIKDLSTIIPTSVGSSQNQTTSEAITRWYPNHQYTYTFKITKKGIENITCTLADWSVVEAGNKDINLED